MAINQLGAALIALTLGTNAYAQEYVETRDLIPMCDSILEITTDGNVAYKFGFTYDRFGGRIDSTHYIKKNGEWINDFRLTHERNEDGNITKTASYNWDAKTEEWIPSGYMYEYFYDGTMKIGEAEYYWNRNMGQYDPKRKIYDYTVNDINTHIYYIVNSDHFEPYSKTVTAKTQDGKDAYVENYSWHNNKNIWEGRNKVCNTYDKAGNLIEEITYTWDKNNDAWYSYPSAKIEYHYDQENYCTGALRYLWSVQAECWYQHGADNYGVREYEYDTAGRIVKIVTTYVDGITQEIFAFDSQGNETYYENGFINIKGVYSLREKNERTYDDHGNLTWERLHREDAGGWAVDTETESNYDYSTGHCETTQRDLKDGQWVETVKTERDFDGEGRTLKYVTYNYDQYLQNWVGMIWEEYAYHANGYYTMNQSFHWDTYQNVWVGSERYEYDFDDKGRQTLWAYYSRMSDDGRHWHPTSKVISHYDDQDRLVKQEVYQSISWGDDPYSWTHTWNCLYYYGGKTIEPDAVTAATRASVFAVYSLDGTKVYDGPASAWRQPRHGVYIVRDGNRTYKVGH